MSPAFSEQTGRYAQAIAANLRVDHTTATVIDAMEATGIRCLLLKGPGISRWLYEGGTRRYVDTDILVNPRDSAGAAAVLAGMGYTPMHDAGAMPEWWRDHAMPWCGPQQQLVDLHRALPGVGVSDEELWEVLTAECVPLPVGGREVRVPSVAARTLHIALHAAQHAGADRDLGRALERVDITTWKAAFSLATRLRAQDAFAAGLLLLPAGRTLVARLGVPYPRSVEVEVRAARMPSEALTMHLLVRTPGVRARADIVRHKLFPPPTYMRRWSKLATRGNRGLVASYVQRAAWLAARAPAALRAWLRACRAVRGRERVE